MERARLHVLTDPVLLGDRLLADVVRACVEAGADVIQLRDKRAPERRLAAIAEELLPVVRDRGARLLVNDHWKVARDVGADGVHVGPDDTPVDRIRSACPRPFVIGASARTVDDARAAETAGADYLGVGPVRGTSSKEDVPAAVGLERITALARAVTIPVIGIGGLTVEDAAAVIRAGGGGVAVLSAVMASDDPGGAVRLLRRRLDAAGPRGPLAGSTPRC